MSDKNKFKYINKDNGLSEYDKDYLKNPFYEELDSLYDKTCTMVPISSQLHYGPIFGENSTWYFKDLVYGGYFGPFDSKEIAASTCVEYAKKHLAFGKYSYYKDIEESINESLTEITAETDKKLSTLDLIADLEASVEASEELQKRLDEVTTPWYKKTFNKVKSLFIPKEIDFDEIYLSTLEKFEAESSFKQLYSTPIDEIAIARSQNATNMWFNYLYGRSNFSGLPETLKAEATGRIGTVAKEFRRRYPFRYFFAFCAYYIRKPFKFIAGPWAKRL